MTWRKRLQVMLLGTVIYLGMAPAPASACCCVLGWLFDPCGYWGYGGHTGGCGLLGCLLGCHAPHLGYGGLYGNRYGCAQPNYGYGSGCAPRYAPNYPMRPMYQPLVYQPRYYQQPCYQQPVYQQPIYQQPCYQPQVYQQPYFPQQPDCCDPCGGMQSYQPIYQQMPADPCCGPMGTLPSMTYQQQAYYENVPVTSYQTVMVDEMVPRRVARQVPMTTYQQQLRYRSVAVPNYGTTATLHGTPMIQTLPQTGMINQGIFSSPIITTPQAVTPIPATSSLPATPTTSMYMPAQQHTMAATIDPTMTGGNVVWQTMPDNSVTAMQATEMGSYSNPVPSPVTDSPAGTPRNRNSRFTPVRSRTGSVQAQRISATRH